MLEGEGVMLVYILMWKLILVSGVKSLYLYYDYKYIYLYWLMYNHFSQ